MQKGLNSDILYNGKTFHIQTEDWGFQNPFFVTQVYQQGQVVKVLKIPYAKVLHNSQRPSPESIGWALESQHSTILDLLVSGQLLSV